MKDPWPECPKLLQAAVRPLCDRLGLYTLPQHIHEVLFFFVLYHTVNIYVAPRVSTYFFPKIYSQLNKRTKINWDVHVVSLFQSSFISAYAFYAMYRDQERKSMDRVWGYTGMEGTVQAFGAGYFLWDLMVSAKHVKIFGVGLLAHAISAITVFSLGFRPFVNYYGPDFLLYELSSPFLNFHWFMDKLNMTGSTAQLINGICLLTVFFGCRLIWGNYASFRVARDVYYAWQNPPAHIVEKGLEVPSWLVFVYLGSNVTLNSLNLYWFSRMISTLRKRFETPATVTPAVTPAKVETSQDVKSLLQAKGINFTAIAAEDNKVIVEGTEVDVPTHLPALVGKSTGSIRQRKV